MLGSIALDIAHVGMARCMIALINIIVSFHLLFSKRSVDVNHLVSSILAF